MGCWALQLQGCQELLGQRQRQFCGIAECLESTDWEGWGQLGPVGAWRAIVKGPKWLVKLVIFSQIRWGSKNPCLFEFAEMCHGLQKLLCCCGSGWSYSHVSPRMIPVTTFVQNINLKLHLPLTSTMDYQCQAFIWGLESTLKQRIFSQP